MHNCLEPGMCSLLKIINKKKAQNNVSLKFHHLGSTHLSISTKHHGTISKAPLKTQKSINKDMTRLCHVRFHVQTFILDEV